MLKSLTIQNAAVIKNCSVDFKDGFSVITGETGSGKSVLLECIGLLCGNKADRDMVRSRENRLTVNGLFDADSDFPEEYRQEYNVDDSGEISISRIVQSDGKNSAKVNGIPVTVAALKELSKYLISINTQNEKNMLSDRSEYYSMLDSYAKNESLLSVYREKYDGFLSVKEKISSLKKQSENKEMMTEILSYQIREIEAGRLSDNDEYEKLEKLRTRLVSFEKLAKCERIVYKALNQNDKGLSASALIDKSIEAIESMSDVLEKSDEYLKKLNDFKYELIDISESVKDELGLDDDLDSAARLDAVDRRLSQLDKLKKKYGSTIAEIKDKYRSLKENLSSLQSLDDALADLEVSLKEAENDALATASEISINRKKAAEKISSEVIKYLSELDMSKTVFEISVLPEKENGEYVLSPLGIDNIDILISVNPGEEMKSLSKVASGGEMSRVMLSVKSSLNRNTGADTVIFDEIDSGVSGSTSEKIGIMLKELSKDTQVISITHSTQIASLSDSHLLVKKEEVNGRAETKIRYLDENERIDELARIIGGVNITESQRKAAKEMIKGKEKNNA